MSAQFRTGIHNNNKTAKNGRVTASRGPGLVLPALAALGIGAPASALELGPANVQSALGQPLRASIAFALRPFEKIAPYCIRVAPGRSASGIPGAGPASVTIGDGVIHLAGSEAVTDPLLGLQITIDCPYSPHLSREYIVFVDPQRPAAADPRRTAAAEPRQPATSPGPARDEPATARPFAAPAGPAPRPAIPAAGTYRVRIGDTLSGIAERLSGRRAGLWQSAEILFAANPDAFIDDNPNLLRAGALLTIPETVYNGTSPAVADRAPTGNSVPTSRVQTSPTQTSPAHMSTARASTAQTSTARASTARVSAAQDPTARASTARASAAQDPIARASTAQASAAQDPIARASTAQSSTAYAGYVPDPAAAGEAPETASVPRGLFRGSPGEVAAAPPAEGLFPEQLASPPETHPATLAESPTAAPEAAPRPGDVRVDAEGLFVSPIDAEETSGAATEAAPSLGSAAEAPHTAVSPMPLRREESGSGSRSWLLWLTGSGVALIVGLLLFGRRLRSGMSGALAPGESFAHRRDADALDEDIEREADETNVDFRFGEGDANARIVRVDADLDDGSGFQETDDIDVAQDFGFSASGGLELGLDVDFSEESPAKLGAPARPRESDVIVEREIPPGDPNTSEYDVSMIVDATRQPLDDADDTEKDLHAIELENEDENESDATDPEEDPFTLSRELDYRILEQDYEDELTATQALAAELSDAARDLQKELYDASGEASLHDLPTVEMTAPGTEPTVDMLAPVTEPAVEMTVPGREVTAEMPWSPGSEATAELPKAASADDDESRTVRMVPEVAGDDTSASEELALVPDAGNDPAAEMEIESATIDTKKLKVS